MTGTMAADGLTKMAMSILRVRRLRHACLPGEILGGEQAWDLLLVLFVADAQGRRLSGREAVAEGLGPLPSGRRWIQVLTQQGLVMGDGDGDLDDPLTLTAHGIHVLEYWLGEAQALIGP